MFTSNVLSSSFEQKICCITAVMSAERYVEAILQWFHNSRLIATMLNNKLWTNTELSTNMLSAFKKSCGRLEGVI